MAQNKKIIIFTLIGLGIIGISCFYLIKTFHKYKKEIPSLRTDHNNQIQKETDEELIKKYERGEFTVIGSKKNPYKPDEELTIVSFHDYKKFNEPPPMFCGTRSTTCYIFFKKDSNIEVITRVYSASSPFSGGLEGDFVNKTINNVPLIKFIDADNVILRSVGGFTGKISFIKINLRTKEIEAINK